MKVIFVSSRKIGSKIIQYGTDSAMSHVAIAFKGDPMVYHAKLDSIHKTHEKEFYKEYRVESEIVLPATDKQISSVREAFVRSIFYQGYDWSSFFFFTWDRIKGKFFAGKQSKENPMNKSDDYICCEIVYILDDYYFKVTGKRLLPEDVDLSMTSPGQLNDLLKSRIK